MQVRVHYDDDLFMLRLIIRHLKAGISLAIDPEIFLDKAVEDILFVDSALARLFGSLKVQDLLVKRAEYYKALILAERAYIDLLSTVIDGRLAFAKHMEPFTGRLRSALSDHQNIAAEAEAIFARLVAEGADDKDLVSQEEYRFLLGEDGEDAATDNEGSR